MKRKPIAFRQLLQQVLPVDRLPLSDQADIRRALAENNPLQIEQVALESIEKLARLGHLKMIEEVVRGEERIMRYRDLTSANTISIRMNAREDESGIIRIPLPMRQTRSTASLDQIRTIFALYNRILGKESNLLAGLPEIMRQLVQTSEQVLGCERVSFAPARYKMEPLWEPLWDLDPDVFSRPYDNYLLDEWVVERNYLVYLPEIGSAGEGPGGREPGDEQPGASPEDRGPGGPGRADPGLGGRPAGSPGAGGRPAGSVPPGMRSLAMVKLGDQATGVSGAIQAWSTRPRFFNEEKLALLSLLAESGTDILGRVAALGNLVFVDSGTQVYNRAYFNIQLDNEIARARREERALGLVIFDIDDFRAVNKQYGYEGGNDVLARVARLLKSGLRPFDSVARWGGEEFAIILTMPITVPDAKKICSRLRRGVEKHTFTVTGLEGRTHNLSLTVSAGGALYPGDAATGADLWRAANAALVHAKEHGKNQVTFYSELAEAGPPQEDKK